MKLFYFKIYLFIIYSMTILGGTNNSKPHSSNPTSIPKNARLDEVIYLCPHNAHANREEGFTHFAQQELSLSQQLALGARAFMLDTHLYKDNIVLAHGKPNGVHAFQLGILKGIKALFVKEPKLGYQKFRDALATLKYFLDNNPREVLFIILENYVDRKKINACIRKIYGLEDMIITQKDWSSPIDVPGWTSSDKKNGLWPTFAYAKRENKRLVIFNGKPSEGRYYSTMSEKENDLFLYTWKWAKETVYSKTDPNAAAVERKKSSARNNSNFERRLLIANLFAPCAKEMVSPILGNESQSVNDYNNLVTYYNNLKKKEWSKSVPGLILALDQIHKGKNGGPWKLINFVNKKLTKKYLRESRKKRKN